MFRPGIDWSQAALTDDLSSAHEGGLPGIFAELGRPREPQCGTSPSERRGSASNYEEGLEVAARRPRRARSSGPYDAIVGPFLGSPSSPESIWELLRSPLSRGGGGSESSSCSCAGCSGEEDDGVSYFASAVRIAGSSSSTTHARATWPTEFGSGANYHIRKGAFDMTFDGDFVVPTSARSRRNTLAHVWAPFYAEAVESLADDEIDAMVTWNAPEPSGNFWSSPLRQTLRYAYRLIDVYRDFIPNDNLDCCNAGIVASDRLDRGTYWTNVEEYIERERLPPSRTSFAVTFAEGCNRCLPVPTSVSYTGSAASWDDESHVLNMFYGFLGAQAMLADQLLYLAHFAFSYTQWPLASGAPRPEILQQATQLGRLALGAVSMVARVLLHEQIHRQMARIGGYGHCENGCCMMLISFAFQCSVFARLGLYRADRGAVDLELEGMPLSDESGCDGGSRFRPQCEMGSPGVEGDETDWTAIDWSSPPECPVTKPDPASGTGCTASTHVPSGGPG